MVIKNRSKICLIISGAIILIALVLTLCGRGINMGIDFEGGLSMQYDLKTAAEKTDVETVLNGMDISSYTITVQGANNNEINIRIKDVAKDDIQKVQADFDKLDRKLSNQGFLSKAKPEVIEKDRARHAELQTRLQVIDEQLAELS